MKRMLVTGLALAIVFSVVGCPATNTPPAPNPVKVRAWSVWTEQGREFTREVFNLEEVATAKGDTEVNFDFAGGSFVSGKIGYKLVGTTDMTYIAVNEDSEKAAKYYAGYPYGFYWNETWYPDGYWCCNSCNGAWYHGACHYHGCGNGHAYEASSDDDDVNFWVIVAVLMAANNFPATAPALSDNGEFSVTVPMGPTVESAVLNVETKNGSFIVTIRGDAYPGNANNEFALTTSVVGSGTVNGAGIYDAGKVVTISATPESGWKFDHWKVNGTLAYSNPGTVTMNSDVAVEATFVKTATQQFALTTSASPAGSGSVSGAGNYDVGKIVTISATAQSGWKFDHWTINGATGYANPGTVTMNSDVSAVAYFVQSQTPPETAGKLIVDLTTAAGIVTMTVNAPDGYTAATFGGIGSQDQIQSIGLQLYYTAAVDGLWTYRQTFAFGGTWPLSGVLTKVSGKTLRFEVVANASGCWGDPDKLVVRLNGSLVPRVADSAGTAFQVNLP